MMEALTWRPEGLIAAAGSIQPEESNLLSTNPLSLRRTAMAILTSTPGEGNKVSVYDVPDSVLQQYAVSGEKAAQMFPESKKAPGSEIPTSTSAMSAPNAENPESLGE